MLGRALGIEPIREPDLTKYTDAAKVAPYAQGMVAAMIEAGIVGGVTADELAPQDNINRASTVTILDRAISTYADEAGATVKADGKGIVLVVAKNVKVENAPEGTKIISGKDATGLTVNGKSVSDDQTYIVPKTEPAKPSSSSSGGHSHSHSYDETTHKCSCGEFDPAVVATIKNTNGYLTLQEAVKAAQSDDTVKLMKNTSENITIPADKTIVIDLNGKKLTNKGSHTIVNNGNLTIKGSGTVDNVTHQKAALVNYGTAVLNGGTYTRSLENPYNNKDNSGGNSYYTILNDKGGNMTINADVKVTNVGHFSSMICNGGDVNSPAMSKLTIQGGVFSGGINTVKNDELGELTITGGSFVNTSQCVIMNWHKANISGGTFETNEGAETVLFTAKYHDTRAIGKLTVTGGNYICKTNQALLCDRYNNSEQYVGTASIAGGTFSRQPETEYIAAGYEAKDNKDGTWTVGAAASTTFAAQVGGVMYTALDAAIRAADENAIVQLLGNVTGQVVIPAGKNLTLDLNGKTIKHSGTAIINNGTLIVKNGAVVSTKNCGIGVGSNSETTILSDVTVTAQESAVITSKSTGASIIIEGGTFKSTDNAVIAGNGSKRDGKPNTIIIEDGTFNGGITSKGYVACGIYAPWKDEITVKGGTFNIKGGAGIVARAGRVTVDGGTFTCTGKMAGMVGDSSVVVPCAALVFDSETNYPALNEGSVILVKNGTFTVQSDVAVAQAVKAEEDPNPRISIQGGSFSGDPSAYVANGYGVKNENGVYTVTEPAAAINDKKYATLAAAINAAQSGETVKLLRDAIGSGISTPDQGTSRESLTIDFDGHTYTMENPAVGSTGTETQAMHWGPTLGKITLKNGTFNVAQGATDVAMAMQNYINLDAEDMVLDFTNITVANYAENEFASGSKWAKYNGKECPMFNNNDGGTEIKLTRCTVNLPDDSTLGGNISGKLTLVNSTFNGCLCFNSTDGKITVDSGSSIKGNKVHSYFDGELNIVCNNGTWTATAAKG